MKPNILNRTATARHVLNGKLDDFLKEFENQSPCDSCEGVLLDGVEPAETCRGCRHNKEEQAQQAEREQQRIAEAEQLQAYQDMVETTGQPS